MTSWSSVLIGCLALVLTAGCGDRLDEKMVAAGVRGTLERQAEAWNRGDIDGFMRPYVKSDELTFSSGGQTERGWQATYDRYKRKYPTPERMGHLTFSDLEVRSLEHDGH